jgi:uncharacterized coiled-coil protein SlyX
LKHLFVDTRVLFGHTIGIFGKDTDKMNEPKRIDELERRFDDFQDETNHNLTMLLGQAWRHGEQLRIIKSTMVERFERLDDRVTETHKELAEVHLHMATKEDLAAMEARIIEAVKQLLQ